MRGDCLIHRGQYIVVCDVFRDWAMYFYHHLSVEAGILSLREGYCILLFLDRLEAICSFGYVFVDDGEPLVGGSVVVLRLVLSLVVIVAVAGSVAVRLWVVSWGDGWWAGGHGRDGCPEAGDRVGLCVHHFLESDHRLMDGVDVLGDVGCVLGHNAPEVLSLDLDVGI